MEFKQHDIFNRGLELGVKLQGNSYRETPQILEEEFNVKINHSTISKWNKKQQNQEPLYPQRDGNCGRKKLIDEEHGRKIIECVENNRQTTVEDLKKSKELNPNSYSASTFKRFLNDSGLKAKVMKEVDDISEANLIKIYNFSQEMIRKINVYWGKVHFSDESKLFSQKSGRCYIRKYDNEDWGNDQFHSKQKMFHGGLEILVWGMISSNGAEHLIIVEGTLKAEDYVNMLRENSVFESFKWKHVFQQDNAKMPCRSSHY